MFKQLGAIATGLVLSAQAFGQGTTPGPLQPGQIFGNPTISVAVGQPMAGRVKLLANTTFFVNADNINPQPCGPTGALTCGAGNDSVSALQAQNNATPFNTLAAATKAIQSQMDWNGFRATINLAHGSSTNYGGALCENQQGTTGALFITGDDSNRAAVTIVAPNGNFGIYATHYCILRLRSVTVADQGSAFYGLEADNYAGIDLQNVAFSTFNSSAIPFFVGNTGHMELQSPISPATDDVFLTGNMPVWLQVSFNGSANFGESDGLGGGSPATYTVNIANGLTFSNAVIVASGGGANLYNMTSGTFTGSTPTGVRAKLTGPGFMFNGGTACNTAIPGTSNCQITQGFRDDANDALTIPWSIANGGTGCATAPCLQAVVATAQIVFVASGVNFNSANTDTTIPITLPSGFTRYIISNVRISGASASISTATFGVFTAAAGGGTAVVNSGTAITVTSASDATNNNAQNVSPNNTNTQSYLVANEPNLFFRVVGAQGSAATGNVQISVIPLP